MNVVAYSLYGLSLAGQVQWRIQMMIGRALQCTACFGIINVIPFLHKNAWSQTPSKTRNEFAWLLICTINYVAYTEQLTEDIMRDKLRMPPNCLVYMTDGTSCKNCAYSTGAGSGDGLHGPQSRQAFGQHACATVLQSIVGVGRFATFSEITLAHTARLEAEFTSISGCVSDSILTSFWDGF